MAAIHDTYSSKELEVLHECEQLLAQGMPMVDVCHFRKLVSDYSRLMKNLSRIIRISDKNELRLQSVSDELAVEKEKIEEMARQLSRYLPQQIYDLIFNGSQSSEIKTQRKLLTVFFSDIQGFTQISASIQPEVLSYYINQYFSEMSEIAIRHGGTIDKFIGDAMMVFFGDPATRGPQEDALACVRMAYEMQQRLAELNLQWEREGLPHPFITRIGINTGYCNVGNFGSRTRMTYTILGGEVNLAARIEGKCEAGGVLMSHETYAQVKNYVDAVEQDPVELKGITLPVKTHALRKLLDSAQTGQSDVQIKLPGAEKLMLKPGEMSLPERLSLVARLRDVANALEGGQPAGEAL